jgi:hypothetical protein
MAYAKGVYISPSERDRTEAFLLLNISPSKGFTRFTFEAVAPDGRMLCYHRGLDENDNLETALLTAWYEYELPPHSWRLFPADRIKKTSFARRPKHRELYFASRNQLCFLLNHFRIWAWAKTEEYAKQFKLKKPVKPLFYLDGPVRTPNPFERNKENREIGERVVALFKERQKKTKT